MTQEIAWKTIRVDRFPDADLSKTHNWVHVQVSKIVTRE